LVIQWLMFALSIGSDIIGAFRPIAWERKHIHLPKRCVLQNTRGRTNSKYLEKGIKLNNLSLNFMSLILIMTRTCCSRYQRRGLRTASCLLRSKLPKPQNFCKAEPSFKTFCCVISAVLSTFSISFVPCYSDPGTPFSVSFLGTRTHLPRKHAAPQDHATHCTDTCAAQLDN
jgi:hypothetical protein